MRWLTLDYQARDHAGREVRLRGFRPSAVDAVRDQKADRELSQLRRRVSALVSPRPRVRTFVIAFGVMGPILAWPMVTGGPAARVTWPTVVLTLAATAFVIARFHYEQRRGISARIATVIRAFLADGRCPGCGYSLVGAPAGEQGRVCCPECAAEWGSEFIHAPIRPSPPLRPPGTWLGRTLAEEEREEGRQRGRVIADADGRALLMRDPALRRAPQAHLEALGRERVEAVRREVRRAAGVAIWPRVMMIVVLAGVPVVLAMIGVAPPGPGSLISRAMGQVLAGLLFAWILAWMLYDMLAHGSSVRAERLASILVKQRVCPACLSAMDEESPAAARITCDGCGAAWPDEADEETSADARQSVSRDAVQGLAGRG